jgi:HD-like signal output (HDOD) protein
MYEWLRRLIVRPAPGLAKAAVSAPPAAASAPAVVPALAPVAPAATTPPAVAPAAEAAALTAADFADFADSAPPETWANTEATPLQAVTLGGPTFDQRDFVNSSYNHWLFGLRYPDRLDLNECETKALYALGQAAASGRTAADMLRRMPGLIPQLLQTLRSEHFAGAQIARKISSDLVLVSAVTRLANSSIQQSNHEVTQISSVEHAVIVIGQEGLRQLITSVAFRPIVDLNSGYYTKLMAPRIWEQSERAAVACRMLASEFNVDPFEAFLAGLVQNAGLQTALRIMDQVSGESRALGSTIFCARLLTLSRQISAAIAEEWKFPPRIVEAIREQDSLKKGAMLSPMGRVLALADYLSKIKLMSEHGKINELQNKLFYDLPLGAMPCYAALAAIS